jgi:uncharacterized protein (TIGR00369 family)
MLGAVSEDLPVGEYTPEMVERVSRMIRDFVPHNQAIGIEVLRVRVGDVWTRMPWDPKLVGNPATGVVHGGAVSTMMDATCGLAIMAKIGRPSSIATLDLRIDYLRAATARAPIVARASCLKVTRYVCFVRGIAYQPEREGDLDDERDPVALVTATFARKRKVKT